MDMQQLKYFKTVAEIGALLAENLFMPMPGDSLSHYLARLFEDADLPFPAGNCYSYLTAQRMVANGSGVAFATAHFIRDATLDIHYIPINSKGNRWVFRFYWRKDRTLTKDEAVMMEYIKKTIAIKNHLC